MDIPISTKQMSRNEIQKYLTICLTWTLVLWFAQFLWKRRYLYIHSWSVEGPLALPFIGCGYLFLGNGTDIINTLVKLQSNMSSDLMRLWFGPKLMYVIKKPEHIEKILKNPKALGKDHVYRFLAEGIGNGLLTAPVQEWKHHRKLLAPSFNQKILDTFVEIFAEQSIIFADQLKTVVGRKDFDLYLLASRCTLDIICQTAMGVNMNVQKEEGEFGLILEEVLAAVNYRIFRVWNHLDFIWHFSPLKVTFDKYITKFYEVTGSVVSKKMAQYKKTLELKQSHLDAEIEEEPSYKRLAFLDLILKSSAFTEKELKDEVEIFLAAGTETTASSISCLFTLLGMHPEVQQKVYEEMIDILGTDRTVLASDLPKMKYTERVIKENLRLFPIAAVFSRSIEEDIDLGDAILPAGSSAGFGTLVIHRNPKYWTDPLKFDPDRFLPEEVAKRHPCTYIPFSYGPRNCIGDVEIQLFSAVDSGRGKNLLGIMLCTSFRKNSFKWEYIMCGTLRWRYAIANMKTIVATVIRQFKIFTEYKSVEEIELKMHLLIRMRDGAKVWLENR